MENLEKNKIKKKIGRITLLFLLILILISLGVSLFYNIKLQEQVDKRDIIIEQLTQRDSILNQIMEFQYDSISKTISYTYRIKDGKVLKYNELSNELDKFLDDYSQFLKKNIKIVDENNQNIEDYNSLIKEFSSLYNDYKDLQKKYNNLISYYNKNIVMTRSDLNNHNLVLDSLSNYKAIVDLIHSNYFIDYKIVDDGKYRKISIKSEKLDSALILLPYFRDRLKKEKNVWKIITGK